MSFEPTHRVGAAPIPTWPSADTSQPAGPNLDPGLEVQLVEQQGDVSKIVCSNGWEAWVGTASIESLLAAPASPPTGPAGPPSATAPVPPPPPPAAAAAPAGGRPAWLIPAAVVAVVAMIAAVVLTSGDDDTSPVATRESIATATTRGARAAAKEFDLTSVFPSPAALAEAVPGNWETDRLCEGSRSGALTGDDDCAEDDIDDFNFLCNDEYLGGTESEERSDPKPVEVAETRISKSDEFVSVTMKARLYEDSDGADEALDEVADVYSGPCQNYEPGPRIYSPVAVAEANEPLGDNYIAYAEIDAGSEDDATSHHVWMRTGRVLFSFDVGGDGWPDEMSDNFYQDLAEIVVANARSAGDSE